MIKDNKIIRKNTLTAIIFAIVLVCGGNVLAAPISNQPVEVTQPNGEELNLFVSGDEYFNYLHDEAGNIIIQNYTTGFYTYAEIENGIVVPGDVIVSDYNYNPDDPDALPVNPQTIIYEDIPEEYLMDMYENAFINNASDMPLRAKGLVNERKTHPFLNETVNNIVIFIDFPDVKFNNSLNAEYFNGILNTNDNSLKNWFETASYGKTSIVSHMYPVPNGSVLAAYTDIYPRTTYQVHHKDENGRDVYMLDGEVISKSELEHSLLQRAVNAVSSQISQELNIDVDNNDNVDSVTFIIAGKSVGWNTLLCSHKWNMSKNEDINGKRVSAYTFVMESSLAPTQQFNSTLPHELFHLYGAPDLYHYRKRTENHVDRWDNMDSSYGQMTSMYMKYKYGNWIDEIPEITDTAQRYELNKNTLPTDNCYLLRSPYSSNEFFVVEYRKKEAPFENYIPGDGVVIFRIDSRFNGNASYNGTTILDEVFVSKNPPANSARYPYYDDTVSLKLQDGTDAGITLDHFRISEDRDSASFKVSFTYDKLLNHFVDKRIADAICAEFNKPADQITDEDLMTITELELNPVGNYDLSVSLEGIEHLSNLQSLILNDCKISDITPISTLTNLEHLELKDNEIEDFSPLENLTALKYLKIRGNISDDYTAVSEYYNNLNVKDFSLDNKDDIVFRIPDFTSDYKISPIRIYCSDTAPDKINIIVEKYSADGNLLNKIKKENFNLKQNYQSLYISSDFNCQNGAYLVISAYERRRFSKLISRCTIKPVTLDFENFN